MISKPRASFMITVTGLVGLSFPALAQVYSEAQVMPTADVPPEEEAAPQKPAEDLTLLDERTAYTVGARKLKLGILAFQYGITDRVSVGTDPPVWALRAVASVLVPNLHVKFNFFNRGPVALTGQVAGYYALIDKVPNSSVSGDMVTIPLTLFASFRLAERAWLHSELAYVFARALGSGGNLDNADLEGAVSTRTGQAGLMAEYRVTRIFSLTARGRYQFYSGPLAFSGGGTIDPYTTVQVDGQLRPRVEHPWQAVGGVAFLWKHFHLGVGAGYGNYFVPGMDIAVPQVGFVPEASLAVVL